VERALVLKAGRMPFGKFGGTLSPLSTPGLGVAEILRRRGGGRGLVTACSGGGQGDAVLVEV
jgi:acetyl-CoA acetyltransferase